jgi:Holliday junction DNA helicase RuvA
MYSYLEGKLVEKTPTHVTIDINGVGYLINISLNTYSQINQLEKCCLLCHFVVREDVQLLYGFYTETERMLFRHLISVSGIGANTARLILSSMTAEDLFSIIANGDANALQTIKGIGGKSAQRIIIDLQDKLGKYDLQSENIPVLHNTKKEEALSGLIILGFNRNVAGKTIDKILAQEGSDISVEQLIKSSLKML